jgi:amino acid adenylation domain-containing protein
MESYSNSGALPSSESKEAVKRGATRVEQRTAENRICPVPRDHVLPLSFAQQRLWLLAEQQNPPTIRHVTVRLQLQGKLNRRALLRALDRIVARHEVLRTTFRNNRGEPEQRIEPRDSGFTLIEQSVCDRNVEQIFRQEVASPFDLSSGPLIRGRLLRISKQEHVLLITQHQIVSDTWSNGVLLNELAALYAAFALGLEDPLAPLEVQYADYANWQRKQVTAQQLKDHLEFWIQNMAGAPDSMQLPTDWPRVEAVFHTSDRVKLRLSRDLTGRMKQLAEHQGVTLFAMLLSGWAVLLGRWSGQDEVIIGTRMPNRQRTEVHPLIGVFEATVALRINLQANRTFEQLLKHAENAVVEATANQVVQFERGVEGLNSARSHGPILQVLMELNHIPSAISGCAALQLPGLILGEVSIGNGMTQFELSLSLVEDEGCLTGTLEYASDLFERQTIQRLADCWKILLGGTVKEIQTPINLLSILPESERELLLFQFNKTAAVFPMDRLIHELFEEQVQRTPEAVAVKCDAQSLTYAQLNGRANQLARYLRDRGVGPDRLVALCVERGVEMVVGMLGILKAGGAYVPLDPNYPPERLKYVLENSAPRMVLTQKRLGTTWLPTALEAVALDSSWDEIARCEDGNLDTQSLRLESGHLAYVIYTSGSTGNPKGVMIEHGSVVNFLVSMQQTPGMDATDRILAVTTVSFDIAALEIYLPLISGAQLLLAPPQAASDAGRLMRMIEELDVTVLQATPATWRLLLSAGWSGRENLKALCGGEVLTTNLSRKLRSRVGSLWNLYGPTETTIWSCCRHIAVAADEQIAVESIGRPIANTRIYILDQSCHLVPVGVVGEIYIAGAGVARGYLNRPEMTAERFVADPFTARGIARMYKTGDLGRWRSDGTIEYLGRNDHQVKIRGFRIELGEIEAWLTRHDLVGEAVVIAREDTPGDKRLVAYVTPRIERVPRAEELRTHLKTVLPEYMVPSAFVILEHFPLTPNGKLDRRALPAPQLSAYVSRPYELPLTEEEKLLADIWQDLLGLERVGRQDNFFELGGHSLLMVQMSERLRRLGLSVPVRQFFESATLADLATALSREEVVQFVVPPNRIPKGCEWITPQMLSLVELESKHIDHIVRSVPGGAAEIQDIYPLAPLQEGLLFHHLIDRQGGDAYVLPTLMALSSRERLDELIWALQKVIDRHDILRTAVQWERLPQAVQVVLRRAVLPIEFVELDPNQDPVEQMKERMRPEHQRLDLRQAPLMRLQIAADPRGGQWYALLQAHHLVCDSESLEILLSEVTACLEGREQALPEPVPYRDHVAQALSFSRTQDTEGFFRSKLAEVDEPTAPFGLMDVHGGASRIESARQELGPELSAQVRARARRLGVSAAILFHAAWSLVVSHTSGRDDVVFGSVLLGRLQGSAGAQRILGMFINTLPLRLQLQGITAEELVRQTQRELVDLLGHEQASLAAAQRQSGISGSAPLFTTLLNYLHSTPHSGSRQPATASQLQVLASEEWTNYPIVLYVEDRGHEFELMAQTDRRIDPSRMTAYFHKAVQGLVEALERSPQIPILSVSILPESERRQVIESFNATGAVYPREKLVHELFEAQVDRTPDAIAVVCGEEQVTYAQLNSKANQLARYLLSEGIRPDQLVGICVERSPEMVVGLLGILKAGGAYVPLDPNYPVERLSCMLEDAAPQVIMIQEELRLKLPPVQSKVIALNTRLDELKNEVDENLSAAELGLTSQDLVYVIFTSGSTGRPKGTAMPHRAMVNLIEWHRKNFRAGEGKRVLQFAALSFDVAFQETFSTLCTGGILVLLDEWVRRDARALTQFMRNEVIDRLFVPPMMLQSLADYCGTANEAPRSLQDVITAGEQLRISPEISKFFRKLDGCRLHNHYGPTETHVVTALTLSGDPDSWPALPTIGRPIANTQIYVLNKHRQPLPVGVPGEIYIGGAGVARGYFGISDLTEQRFVADPFSTELQARLYKTGDLGRWRADGTLEYLGRNDDQVKIRGYRIEPGEIEAQLARHEQVSEAVVVAREDVPGEKRLVAYVTGSDPSVEGLRAYLKAALPEHMVPSAFVILQSLPLTPSGKLNRRALPKPALHAYANRMYQAPQGAVEEALARIWQDLLRIDQIGRQDNFFELGGHSLLATRVVTHVSYVLDVDLPLRAMFEKPTIEGLGHCIMQEIAAEIASEVSVTTFLDGLSRFHGHGS